MRTSESIANIAAALSKAQAECATVTKDKTAKVKSDKGNYEYKYSDFASVVDELKPALAAHGLAMIQWGERHDNGITVITRVQHESGEWQETDTFIPVGAVSAQAVGSALTYGKRYGAQAFMLMPSADDDGKAATDSPPPAHEVQAAKRGDTARQECIDAFEAMAPDQKDYLRGLGLEVTKLVRAKTNPNNWWEQMKFDQDEELAIWSLLDSDVRRVIKEAKNAAKEAKRVAGMRAMKPTPAELGSQA